MSILDAPLALAGRFHASRGRGWNTWDTRSVLRHVLLPEGLGVSLGFAAPDRLLWVEDACFGCTELARTAGTQLTSTGRQLNVSNTLEVRPGPRSYDGSYTQLEVDLRGARFRVETAAEGDRWIALITPLQDEPWPRALTVHARPLWNSPCTVRRGGDRRLLADLPDRELAICADGEPLEDPNLPTPSPYLALRLDRPVAVSAGEPVAVAEAQQRIHAARVDLDRLHAHHGPLAEAHQAMQACIAWNVIYEPRYRRVICPVARDWNCKRGGYVLFCWDSFFTAWMITLDDPALGYACAIETFREMVDESFVPNVAQATGE